MSLLDVAGAPAKLEAWLAANVAPATVERYEVMTGGFSRAMVRVDLIWEDGRKERFVLRGDPPPEIATLQSDRAAEWALLSALSAIDEIPTPNARWFIDDESIFGTKALLIDFIDGGSLQASLDAGLDLDAAVEPFAQLLACVAGVEPDRLPATFARPESWDSYLDGIIGRWRHCADRHCESLPFVRYISAWLAKRRPAPAPLRLIHGDFQQGNIVATPDGWQLVDWEFSRIGDPREDLGYYNAYAGAVPPNLLTHDLDGFLAAFRAHTGMSEELVNPVTLGYFTVLSTIESIDGLYDGIDAFSKGERRGAAVAYNVQLIPVGNDGFVNAIDGLEAAIAAAEGH